MPQGDKSAYTPKQKRQARHIEESEEQRGRSGGTAARIAWATVNKQDGGGKRKRRASHRAAPRTGTRAARPARPARTVSPRKRTRTVQARP